MREAQHQYDNEEPPEEEPRRCPECEGAGCVPWGPRDQIEECRRCGGEGSLS